jgi:hypothetical protein
MGTGSKSFTVNQAAGTNAYIIGDRVRIVSTSSPANYMEGAITAYATNLLTVNIDYVVGSGTIAVWGFSITGALGSTGPTGPAGNTGPSGPAGNAGTIGATGPQGPSGPTGGAGTGGAAGPQGPQGAQGNTGPAGAAGPQGVSGPQGPQGPTGNQGNVGPQGPQGNVGATGPQGPTGPQGNTGATGPLGPTGAAGTNGNNGANGSQGATGATGPGTLTSGTANNVAYYSASQTLTGSANFTWNGNTVAINGALTVTGDITAFSSSDEKLKTHVLPIANALEKTTKLSGVTFNWNAFADGKDLTIREAGVIAQQVQEVLPEAVVLRDNGYLAVRYEKIIPLLIEAIKELESKVKELEKRVS